MSSFEEDIIRAVKQSVARKFSEADSIDIDCDQKQTLPPGFLEKAWESIDWDIVLKTIKPALQKKICDAIVDDLEAGVKSLLSVDGIKEKSHIIVYPTRESADE